MTSASPEPSMCHFALESIPSWKESRLERPFRTPYSYGSREARAISPTSFKLIRHFGDARLGASIVLLERRSRASHRANSLIAHLDRSAPTEGQDIGQVALPCVRRVLCGALLKLGCRRAEHPRGVRFAPGPLRRLPRSLLVPQNHQQLSRAIHHRDRRVVTLLAARRERGFGDGLGQAHRQITLHHQPLTRLPGSVRLDSSV